MSVFSPETLLWKLDLNRDNRWEEGVDLQLGPFSGPDALPVVGDWDGSGTSKVGVFDPITGLWELDSSGNGKWDSCGVDTCLGPFGQDGDLPVAGPLPID